MFVLSKHDFIYMPINDVSIKDVYTIFMINDNVFPLYLLQRFFAEKLN